MSGHYRWVFPHMVVLLYAISWILKYETIELSNRSEEIEPFHLAALYF